MALLIFFLILSVLILIHEFGHFIVAKKNGILVEEFGLGIPPRIIGKKIGETLYSLNALPFGGFVKLYGEDPEESTENILNNPRSFLSKTPLQRAAVLTAGVFMNFILAIVLYYVLFGFTGFKTLSLPVFFDYQFKYGQSNYTNTVVSGFSENSPALQSGVQPGEAIVSIDNVNVTSLEDIRDQLIDKPNTEVSVTLKDIRSNTKDLTREIAITTAANNDNEGILGVYITDAVSVSYENNKILAPFLHSANMIAYTGSTFKNFIGLSVETKSVEPVTSSVAGPVGIYSVVEGILSFGGVDAYLGLIDFTALLSLSLALMNILPLPALDGGRLVFIVYEMIFRKKVDLKVETSVHKWGMIFFFGLLILITVKDIVFRIS